MEQQATVDPLQELLDREAIRDVVTRYCRAIDRNNAGLLRTVYWPDAIDDHGMHVKANIEEHIAAAISVASACVATHHQIGNILIHLDGALARVETYVTAHHRIEGPTRPHWRTAPAPIPADQQGIHADLFVGARYVDRMEKRAGVWRVAYREIAYDWYHTVEGQDWSQFPYAGFENFHLGSGKADDVGARLFAQVAWV
jgi:hypothetical protein